jgi:hypothetical protein
LPNLVIGQTSPTNDYHNGAFAACEERNKKFACEELVTSHVTKTCVMPEAKGHGLNCDVCPNGARIVSAMPAMRMDTETVKFPKTRDVAVMNTLTLLLNERCQHHK